MISFAEIVSEKLSPSLEVIHRMTACESACERGEAACATGQPSTQVGARGGLAWPSVARESKRLSSSSNGAWLRRRRFSDRFGCGVLLSQSCRKEESCCRSCTPSCGLCIAFSSVRLESGSANGGGSKWATRKACRQCTFCTRRSDSRFTYPHQPRVCCSNRPTRREWESVEKKYVATREEEEQDNSSIKRAYKARKVEEEEEEEGARVDTGVWKGEGETAIGGNTNLDSRGRVAGESEEAPPVG